MNNNRTFGSVVSRTSVPRSESSGEPSGNSTDLPSSGAVRSANSATRLNPNVTSDIDNDYSDGKNSFPSDFGVASGESASERQAYNNAYAAMRDYPEWITLLDQNPYTGFMASESFFDSLGLSHKAKDKLNSYRQAYKEYISDVLLKFMSWKNSLPSTQRLQQVQAGYNPDTIDVQPSSISAEGFDIKADPTAIESGSSGQEILSVLGSAMSTMSAVVSGGTAIAQVTSNLVAQQISNRSVRADVERKELENFKSAYDIAKTIFGETSDAVKTNAGELKPSTKFDLQNAPKSVTDMLNAYQHSRGFQTAQNQSVTEANESDTAVISSDMEKEQTDVLYGNKDTWVNLKQLHTEATRLNLENIDAYLELYDPLLSASSQNAYSRYMSEFYSNLDGHEAAGSQNDLVDNLRKSLALNKKVIETKRKMVEIRAQMVDSLFHFATEGNWWQSKSAKAGLMALDFGGDYLGIGSPAVTPISSNNGTTLSTPVVNVPDLQRP